MSAARLVSFEPNTASGPSGAAPIIVGLGVALTTMKQLRLGNGFAGPGEILLALSCLGLVFRHLIAPRQLTPGMSWIVLFGLSYCLLLTTSTIIESSQMVVVPDTTIADAASIWAGFGLAVILSALLGSWNSCVQAVFWTVSFTVMIQFIAFLATRMGVNIVGPFSLMYGSSRFEGLSDDPNQLSRITSIAPFLCLISLGGRGGAQRIAIVGILVMSIILGIATLGIAGVVAWISGASVMLVFYNMRARNPVKRIFLTLLLSGIAILLVLTLYNTDFVGTRVDFLFTHDDGSSRRELAKLSIEQLLESTRTMLFGHGFGFHLLWTSSDGNSFVMESHDVILDSLVRGGLVGLGLMLGCLVVATQGGYRIGNLGMGFVTALIVYSVAITPLRQPIFWMALMTCASAGWAQREKRGPARTTGAAIGWPV